MERTPNISRRSFVAAGAALAGMAAASAGLGTPLLSQAEEAASGEGMQSEYEGLEVRHAFCQMCGPARTHCSTLCYLKEGRWINVEGNPQAGNNWGRGSRTLCAKGNSAMQVMYSPTRLEYPMKRTGEKGEGKFERITWEQAIEEISAKLLEQKEKYGPESYGVLSPQYYAVLGTLGRRFLNVHGSPNYLHSAICNSQRMFSNLITLGGPNHMACNKTMPGQLGNAVKEQRAARAAQVAAELETEYNEAMAGKVYPVLFEQVEHGLFTGHAPNYVKVYAKGEELHNAIKSVRITGPYRDGVLGEIV